MSDPPTTPLAHKIVPAQRATTSLAEQMLLISPTYSALTASDDLPSSPFGEPVGLSPRVTKTYVGRKARLGYLGDGGGYGLARGKAKAQAQVQVKAKTSASVGVGGKGPGRRANGSAVVGKKAAPMKKKKRKVKRKRAVTPSDEEDEEEVEEEEVGDDDDDDNSDGTDPLIILASEDIVPPRKRRHTFSAGGGGSPSPAVKPAAWPPTTPLSVRRKAVQERWDLSRLETFVWVLVDKMGRLVGVDGDQEDVGEGMWWPAKIRSKTTTAKPLRVTLFGELFQDCALVEIDTPSERNIQPMLTVYGDLRFTSTTYLCTHPTTTTTTDDIHGSPRKKHKSNLQSAWHAAVDAMMEEHEIDNDGLPSLGIAFSESLYGAPPPPPPLVKPTPTAKGRGKKRSAPDENNNDTTDRWSPPPQDPTLMIPGELILAREPKGTYYWPGMLQQYVAPTNHKGKPKYRVRYLDDSVFDVTRDTFYTSEEDGFAFCKLGMWESSYKNVIDDKDDSDVDEEEVRRKREREREPSAVPLDPLPTREVFCDLGIEEQFCYAKPVLEAILREGYVPARRRHDDFVRGGMARKVVVDNACARGTIVPEDVERLQERLLEWALRDERRAKRMVDDGEVEGVGEEKVDVGVEDVGAGAGAEEKIEVEPAAAVSEVEGAGGDERIEVDVPAGENIEVDAPEGAGAGEKIDLDERPGAGPVIRNCALPDESVTPSASVAEVPPPSVDVPLSPASKEPNQTADETITADADPVVDKSSDESQRRGCEAAKADDKKTVPSNADATITLKSSDDPQRPARQRGCAAYEALSGVEKLEYCTNVLLPEAILQILLWRSGDRRSLDVLDDEEEERLHALGAVKMQETDWVHDVMRLRETKVRVMNKRARKEGAGVGGVGGGTRSRPGRGGAKRGVGGRW